VIVHGRDTERGAQTVKDIERSGGKARFLPANLSDPGEIQRLAEQVGDIDVLVNNAGHSAWGPTADLDVVTFDGMFADNVRAPFYLVADLFDKLGATTPLNRAAEPAEIADEE
jgi:NAD(P)-dependent dehydrogenase (short-subunit alcohol dehydrogenase family)